MSQKEKAAAKEVEETSVELTTTDDVVEKKEAKKVSEAPNTAKIGDQEMTASQFATIAGVGVHTMFWVNKTFDPTEMRSANSWCDVFMKEKAIDEAPEILKEKVS